VRAHAVARAVFGVDRMWDAVRPLDNRVSAAVQVEVRTEATRLSERAARWLLRLPELVVEPAAGIGDVVARFDAPVAAVRAGLPGWLLGAEATAYAERSRRLQAGGVPAELAADVAAAPLLPAALDLAVVTESTGAPIELAGQVQQYLAERLGLVPLRERVIALPRDRRWNSMARASLRDDLAAEQAALTADVLGLADATDRDGKDAAGLVARWEDRWDAPQRRAAAQLADITTGDRQDLAELLVAVRTLRGLHRR
jgi:glutamate dehydrogenase